jgi:hypothetical protein
MSIKTLYGIKLSMLMNHSFFFPIINRRGDVSNNKASAKIRQLARKYTNRHIYTNRETKKMLYIVQRYKLIRRAKRNRISNKFASFNYMIIKTDNQVNQLKWTEKIDHDGLHQKKVDQYYEKIYKFLFYKKLKIKWNFKK